MCLIDEKLYINLNKASKSLELFIYLLEIVPQCQFSYF